MKCFGITTCTERLATEQMIEKKNMKVIFLWTVKRKTKVTFTTLTQLKDPERVPSCQGFLSEKLYYRIPRKNQQLFSRESVGISHQFWRSVLRLLPVRQMCWMQLWPVPQKASRHLTPIEVPEYLCRYALYSLHELWSQQRNLCPLDEIFTCTWSRVIPRITTQSIGRTGCHAVSRQIAL